jgi:hypothetical protein
MRSTQQSVANTQTPPYTEATTQNNTQTPIFINTQNINLRNRPRNRAKTGVTTAPAKHKMVGDPSKEATGRKRKVNAPQTCHTKKLENNFRDAQR